LGNLLTVTEAGATCAAGGFVVDPLLPVRIAVITHAHGDHLRPGCAEYVTTEQGAPLARKRLGPDAKIRALAYGEPARFGPITLSLHPAGHVLGSAQVRLTAGDDVWVVSGDYKRAPDPTCAPFEVVPCDVFVTEATFALPIFRWEPTDVIALDILDWWEQNRAAGRASLLLGYALGKAQRILAELAGRVDRPVRVHGAVEPLVQLYREAGVEMAPTKVVGDERGKAAFAGELIVAPPGWEATPWARRFGADAEVGLASGAMLVRGNRRRRSLDRGFALSDHADWPALLATIADSGAKRVLVTHGFVDPLVRWLVEHGVAAEAFRVGWEPEERPEGRVETAQVQEGAP
jgi:putative mRNA 3-end processing factor